jgi:TetR/AcrR family transcriptional regulator, tetracycline repressor protein
MGPPHHGESWQHWLTRRARAYRRSLLAHRDGAGIVANAQMSPATLGMLDEELTAMVERGFTPTLALRTIMAIAHYVNGFVLQEQTERQEDTQPPAGEPAAMTEQLDGDSSATLLEAIREGGSPLGEDAFEHGLQALIDGTTTALTP